MKRDEYFRSIQDISDPYSVWIREKEIKREEKELNLPPDYTLYLDGDGDIDPGLASALEEYGAFENGFDFIYADEDETDRRGKRHDPFFKPDYSPDTLESFYYPGGFTIVKNALVSRVSGEYKADTGSLDFLRECALNADKPLHIPEVLYHAGSRHEYGYKDSPEGDKNKKLPESIAVIILSRDHPDLLRQCLKGLFRAAGKEETALECVVLDNGSSEGNTSEYEGLSEEYGFSYIREEREFCFSALCNKGAGLTGAEILLFLNDDIEIPENTLFLRKMMGEALREKTGAVGCKLLYPGGEKIQHIGISLLKSGGSHCFSGYRDDIGYQRGVNRIKRNVFAVTGACLMVERRKFNEASGFDERLKVAYTDTDLCASLLSKGYYNVCLNSFFLIHHESLTRKSDGAEMEKYYRLKEERDFFYDKYRELLKKGDPWYNRNLTGTELDMGVDVPSPEDRIPFYSPEKLEEAETGVRGCRRPEEGRVHFNIENCSRKTGDAMGHEDFIEIRGWGFVHGHPGYSYDVFILIHDSDRDYLLNTGRIFRNDLKEVFPKEKDVLLSGFGVKAAASQFKAVITEDRIALIFRGKDLFGRDRSFIVNES